MLNHVHIKSNFRNFLLRSVKYSGVIFLPFFIVWSPPNLLGVELDPSPDQISEVMENAKNSLGKLGYFPNPFGQDRTCNWGYLQTKLFNIWVKTRRLELEYKTYAKSEIQKDLNNPRMVITFALCTNNPHKRNHTIHMTQNETIIQPEEVWVTYPDIITAFEPNAYAYSMTIRASFPYSNFDPHGLATVHVIPESGTPLEFSLDLSHFP